MLAKGYLFDALNDRVLMRLRTSLLEALSFTWRQTGCVRCFTFVR